MNSNDVEEEWPPGLLYTKSGGGRWRKDTLLELRLCFHSTHGIIVSALLFNVCRFAKLHLLCGLGNIFPFLPAHKAHSSIS